MYPDDSPIRQVTVSVAQCNPSVVLRNSDEIPLNDRVVIY